MDELGFISPRATISPKALIAPDVRIYGPALVGEYVVLGPQVVIGHPSSREQANLVGDLRKFDDLDRPRYDELIDAVVHKETLVEHDVAIRSGCVVYSGTRIYRGADLAHNCLIRENSEIGTDTHILTGTQIMVAVRIGGGCRIAGTLCNRTEVGHSASMLGHTMHRYKVGVPGHLEKSPMIGDGVIVGREAAVIGDVQIGRFAIVGAGAVITQSVPSLTIWAGNPAQLHGSRDLQECDELVRRVQKYAQ